MKTEVSGLIMGLGLSRAKATDENGEILDDSGCATYDEGAAACVHDH